MNDRTPLRVDRVAMNGSMRARLRLWTSVRRSGAHIFAPFRVTGPGGSHASRLIEVGAGTRIGQFAWFSLTSRDAVVRIGRNCTINSSFSASVRALLEIGDEVGIGDRAMVMDHEHAPNEDGGFSWDVTEPAPVRIGSGVHIGVNVVIMPGVQIGEHARIGANSVVTRSVPAGATVAGTPARPVGRSRHVAPEGPETPPGSEGPDAGGPA